MLCKPPKSCGTLRGRYFSSCWTSMGRQFSETATLWGEGVQLAMPSLCSKEKPHFTLKPQKCALGFAGWSLFWKFHGQNQQSCGRRLCGAACSGSSVLSFQVRQAPSKASGLLRGLVWVSFKWCPWMWLVFAFHSNIYYKAFLLGNLPVKGAKLKGWKASSFMRFGDIKQSSVSLGQTWDSKPVCAGPQGPLVFIRGGNPYASHHQTVPAHCT